LVYNQLHFEETSLTGGVFGFIGALSEFGKFGVTCIGNSPESAHEIYQRTRAAMARENLLVYEDARS
jgi:hypothetical protein